MRGRDRLYSLPGEFRVVRCRSCGLMRTDPRPTPETMGFYYADDYRPHHDTRVDDPDETGGRSPGWAKRLSRVLVRLNTRRIPRMRPGRLLEIGCGSGAFLHKMAALGWEVEGVELSPKAAAAARALGYRVFAGAVEKAPDPGKPYDLVVGWMVLEHLHDPVASLQKLRRWTNPEGWLAVSMPNAGAVEFRAFGDAWYALQLPTHLFHYTPRTLARVLELGGWKMERVFHQRVLTNLLASAGCRAADRHLKSRFSRFLLDLPSRRGTVAALYPLAFVLSLLGQTGRMTVWAKPGRVPQGTSAGAALDGKGATDRQGASS